jgi:osmotically inducible protein OsmC
MAVAERRASIVWEGDVQKGGGKITMDSSGAFGEFGISLPTRTESPEGHTSPEELLAASHAGCYAMAFSLVLSEAGNPPDRLEASADVVLDRAGEGFAVTTIALTVRGKVPGLDQAGFEEAAQRAEQSCPISNALRGNVEISLDAQLEES